MHLPDAVESRKGALFHVAGGVIVFLVWRIAGMPSPGSLGRVIPLAWGVAGIMYGRGPLSRYSLHLLGSFCIAAMFWRTAPAALLFAESMALLALFPALLEFGRGRMGIARVLIVLMPLVLSQVPFTGDEPHYAMITERLAPGDGSRFSAFSAQSGDPAGGISHHQSLYPAMMIPGYPLGHNGLRAMNLIFALAALLLMQRILQREGVEKAGLLSVAAVLTIPGMSVLGLLYPEWLALAVFLGAVAASKGKRARLWVVAAALLLPALKFRFTGISLGLLAAMVLQMKGRSRLRLILTVTALAAAGLAADGLLMGGRLFWVRYGNMDFIKTLLVQPLYRTPEMLLSVFSTFLDAEGGLLWKAPWILAGIAGIPLLRKRSPGLFLWLGLPALGYSLLLIYWTAGNWSGFPTPAGRMLLPLLPLFTASLGMVLQRRGVRLLLGISMAVGAAMYVAPELRFNFGDGTDAMMSLIFRPGTLLWLPTQIRPSIIVYGAWTAAAAIITFTVSRNSRYARYAVLSAALVFLLQGSGESRTWEAEDLPEEYVRFCSIYPRREDVEERKYWLFSREPLLRMGPDQGVVLPVNAGEEEILELRLIYRAFGSPPYPGIAVECGCWTDSVRSDPQLMDPPGWVTVIRSIDLPGRPENMQPEECSFMLPPGCDTVRISPFDVTGEDELRGIYLDRIRIE